ncbi:protein-tyrosine phosphatase [Labedella gwakjiensis]|uniref:Low molecular weight phosphatase family protein n=1 Tax=Labedella gwakjiensis TaxID=390269 RepID=A0A2P8GY75_9MICO|nr:low molecular weight phosphatase family protein [Labedella gwakjiensis]PSL38914.1 protein-tyrosine phosphatase [Labedella gwakjiensis]RUQ86623.1 low molecular weight phosphatase family protein [Labedella gwakjiensis]
MTATFEILTVCTGNICRSPLAEQILRSGLADIPRVSVASAGVYAMVGSPMTPEAAALSVEFGGLGSEHHLARDLSPALIDASGLVFAMSREHRRSIVEMRPRAARTTFTLREFARLADGTTDDELSYAAALPLDAVRERLAEAVIAVGARRGIVERPVDPADDDIVDPHRRGDAIYRESAGQLVPAAEIAVRVLRRAATITSPSTPGAR